MSVKTPIITEAFKKAYDYAVDNKLYLGLGYPDSKILLIGKESSDDSTTFDQASQKNLNSWGKIMADKTGLLDFNFFSENSLYPWKGQQFTIRSPNKDGSFKGEKGTSSTWYNYQYFTDLYLQKPIKTKEDLIDFHEHCFQSELNQLNAKYSHLIPKDDSTRIESIQNRQKLFSLDFFQQFEIIILATGHYTRDFNFDIESTFQVKWTGKTHVLSSGNWYNVHYDDPKNPNRIVIHTRQFSSGISKALIQAIATLCRNFKNNQHNPTS